MLKKIISNFVIFLIKLYQWCISPILKTNCRFLPTCSEYTIQSIEEYGLLKGGYLSIKRISRCHPFGGGGYDPIQKKIKKEI